MGDQRYECPFIIGHTRRGCRASSSRAMASNENPAQTPPVTLREREAIAGLGGKEADLEQQLRKGVDLDRPEPRRLDAAG